MIENGISRRKIESNIISHILLRMEIIASFSNKIEWGNFFARNFLFT